MKKFIALLLISFSANVFAIPSTTTAKVTNDTDGIINQWSRIKSHHHYHIVNRSGKYIVYHMTMTLCPVGKSDYECEIYRDHIGVSDNKTFDFDKDLHKDLIYRVTGEHSVVATTSINEEPSAITTDQKYLWIHY